MSEWKELKTLQEVAEAQRNGEEIQQSHRSGETWEPYNVTRWFQSSLYRSRPAKKTKTKTVVLREALLTSGSEYYTGWYTEKCVSGVWSFVQWLDTPERIVEIEE